MTAIPTLSAPRPPGRPRSSHADAAIVDAVLSLLAEGTTVEALTMEAVAARAGVGKATIYRRFADKDELVLAAVEAIKPRPPEPLGESVVTRLHPHIIASIRTFGSPSKCEASANRSARSK